MHPDPIKHPHLPWLLNVHPSWSSCSSHSSPPVHAPLSSSLLIYKSDCTLLCPKPSNDTHFTKIFILTYRVLRNLDLITSLNFSHTLFFIITPQQPHSLLSYFLKCTLTSGPLRMLFPLPGANDFQMIHFLTFFKSMPKCHLLRDAPLTTVHLCTHTHGKFLYFHHTLLSILYFIFPPQHLFPLDT